MEERMVEIEVPPAARATGASFGGEGIQEMVIRVDKMFGRGRGGGGERRKMKVRRGEGERGEGAGRGLGGGVGGRGKSGRARRQHGWARSSPVLPTFC